MRRIAHLELKPWGASNGGALRRSTARGWKPLDRRKPLAIRFLSASVLDSQQAVLRTPNDSRRSQTSYTEQQQARDRPTEEPLTSTRDRSIRKGPKYPDQKVSSRPKSATRLLARWMKRRHDSNFSYSVLASEAAHLQRDRRLPALLLQYVLSEGCQNESSSTVKDQPAQSSAFHPKAPKQSFVDEELLAHLAWILEPGTPDERIERFTQGDQQQPQFMLRLMLRRDGAFMERKSFERLLAHLEMVVQDKDSWCNVRPNAATFLDVLDDFAYHSRRLYPESVVSLASVAVSSIQKLGESSVKPLTLLRLQTEIFNRSIQILGDFAFTNPLYYASYNWEAQKALLELSATFDPPLLIVRPTYEAIQRVLLALGKTDEEHQVAQRLSPSWPPYPVARDGIEEQFTSEDNWSRAFKAGVMMQESGYAKREGHEIVDLLSGVAPDRTPTVATRTALQPKRATNTTTQVYDKLDALAAWMRSTRNAQEAWAIFNQERPAGEGPNAAAYREMFRKIHAPDAPGGAYLPGDGKATFPPDNSRLTAAERLRVRPPLTEELYRNMSSAGVRPDTGVLVALLRQASDRTLGKQILSDNNMLVMGYVMDSVPHRVQAAHIDYLCRTQPNRTANTEFVSETQLRRIRAALSLTRELSAPGSQEDVSLRLAYRSILQALARPNIMLSNEEAHIDIANVVGMFLETLRSARRRCGIEDETISSIAVLIPKFLSYRLEGHKLPEHLVEQCHEALTTTFWEFVLPESRGSGGTITGASEVKYRGVRIPRPVQLHLYMRALAILDNETEMVRALELLFDEANRRAVSLMAAASGQYRQADVVRALCVFRAVAEPRLPQARVEELRGQLEALRAASSHCSGWHWPTDGDVAAYVGGDRMGWMRRLREAALASRKELSPELASVLASSVTTHLGQVQTPASPPEGTTSTGQQHTSESLSQHTEATARKQKPIRGAWDWDRRVCKAEQARLPLANEGSFDKIAPA